MTANATDYAAVFRAAARGVRWHGEGPIHMSDAAHFDAMARVFSAVADVFENIAKAEALAAQGALPPVAPPTEVSSQTPKESV